MKRHLSLVVISIAVLVTLGTLLTMQPAGSARVVRRERHLTVSRHRLAWRTFGGDVCFVPLRGTSLYFAKTLEVRVKSGESFEIPLSFLYDPPAEVPPDWPAGDWCSSLEEWLRGRLAVAASGVSSDAVTAHRREISEQISAALQRDLRAASIHATSVAARIELPAGWERTRAVPEIARLA